MSEIEMRILIAEACGWRWHQNQGQWTNPHGSYRGDTEECLPDYLNDLNAIHEAEKVLTEKQVPFYLTKLLQVRYRTGADHGMIACMQDKLAFATARQRSEAFLRTLGLWK